MTFLPSSLKKAEKTLSELYSECIQAAGDEVLRGTNDWTSLQQTKLIPSQIVASEWDKREKEHASFLETKKKELKEMLMDTSYHQLSIRGKSRPDLMKREAAVRFVDAILGEGKKEEGK